LIPRACVTTSGRKFRTLPTREALVLLLRVALGGPDSFRRPEGLAAWYGPRQSDPEERQD